MTIKNSKLTNFKIKLKKGDTVKVLIGKDQGKTGKVEKIIPKRKSAIVGNINVYKRHVKSRSKDQKGGIIDITKPILVSKVSLVCPKCTKTTRIGYLVDKSNAKHRICRKCKQIID